MNSHYKLAVLLSRFFAVIVLLYYTCYACYVFAVPLFSGPGDPITPSVSLRLFLAPVCFCVILWLAAPLVAKLVPHGLD